MILVDASIWIDHFRHPNARLFDLLHDEKVLNHPLVIGELAMGSLRNRRLILRDLSDLRQATVASHAEVIALVDWQKLYSLGLGFIDAHLLTSTRLTEAKLWTRDQRLHAQAQRLGVADGTSHPMQS